MDALASTQITGPNWFGTPLPEMPVIPRQVALHQVDLLGSLGEEVAGVRVDDELGVDAMRFEGVVPRFSVVQRTARVVLAVENERRSAAAGGVCEGRKAVAGFVGAVGALSPMMRWNQAEKSVVWSTFSRSVQLPPTMAALKRSVCVVAEAVRKPP